jgi:D-alanyl-D-alanine carboxypeptidase/D-alanyl-D-alanine-endopeptidase (penicillin-binding protein 4)
VLCLPNEPDQFDMYGRGWSWDDYAEAYQPERNRLNIYGNVMTVENKKQTVSVWPKYFLQNQSAPKEPTTWSREKLSNQFYPLPEPLKAAHQKLPFITDNQFTLAKALIEDSLVPAMPIVIQKGWHQNVSKIISTVPTDSLLKTMMYRSDNFFAEQVLLMTSQQLLGRMDDAAIIDTVLKTDFASLPQTSKWVDGSGLSRFNLTTPENYIALLQKMDNEFPTERIQAIFPQGGKGTLSTFYKNIPGVLFAKTGTLGNQIALSGYIITKKGTKLIFSVLIANHVSPSTYPVRQAVEEYLTEIMSKY